MDTLYASPYHNFLKHNRKKQKLKTVEGKKSCSNGMLSVDEEDTYTEF
jgi:hypothetical protein